MEAHLLDGRVAHLLRRERRGERLDPALVDLLGLAAHRERVDSPRAAKRSHGERDVVALDPLEEEGIALLVRHRLEHPAGDAADLPVLVDLLLDTPELPMGLEVRQVLAQIQRRSGGHALRQHRVSPRRQAAPASTRFFTQSNIWFISILATPLSMRWPTPATVPPTCPSPLTFTTVVSPSLALSSIHASPRTKPGPPLPSTSIR